MELLKTTEQQFLLSDMEPSSSSFLCLSLRHCLEGEEEEEESEEEEEGEKERGDTGIT